MEYILLIIFGLLLLLLLIAVIKTALIKDKPYQKLPVSIPQDLQMKYARELAEMIKIKTISAADEDSFIPFLELQKVMDSLFPNVDKTVEKHKFPGGSLLYKWPGKNAEKQPLLFMAHQDVVPALADGWTVEPFSGLIKDGEIWGRGTFDTKCTLYAFFKAADELIAEGFVPETDIWFASSSDEETSGTGAASIVKWLKEQKVSPSLVLDEGGAIVEGVLPSVTRPMALLGVIEKGYIDLKVKAKSHGGHSSTPPANTPLVRLSRFVVDIDKHFPLKTKMIKEVEDMFVTASSSMSFPFRLLFGNMWLFKPLLTILLPKINSYGRALLSTTIAFTQAKGSDAANVIPSEAYLIVNLRTHPIQNIESTLTVIRKIAAKYDLECEFLNGREASPIVNTKSNAYKMLVEAVKQNYPDVLISPYVIMGGTDARHYTEICDAAIRFSPIRVNNADLKKMHGINESIKIETVAEAVVFYKYLMKTGK
ncbi:MAG: M20/M25/M40 family metallo-hydrolase [Candidatus Izemoplasmatales bacterium]|jgi:carboxypeptidase PM20D1|nr:M20/M25/M40 family metallo-hydrolase [Candidatus Izemoplasmatales bacterium]